MATIETRTLSCKDGTGKMIRHPIKRRAVGPSDVHIKVAYSGICHSDIHTGKEEWGPKKFPLCVGHEIIGEVVSVGSDVKNFKVGDKAGVGCFTDSCRKCEECLEGEEQYCANGMVGTYGSDTTEEHSPGGVTQGGYSSDIVVDEKYTLHVPDNLYNAQGAPLLCAGITCYSPFKHYGLKAGMKLGIVGLGGLGHIAVKIGVAMGCEVTVVSTSENKRETAMKLGASKFVVSKDKAQMEAAAKSLHFIYNCIAFAHDVNEYIGLLKTSGTMVMVGGVPQPMGVSAFTLLVKRVKLGGSLIGGIAETQEMLDFCSKNNCLCEVEVIPATPEAVDAAWDRAVKADVKYRFVIDTAATLTA